MKQKRLIEWPFVIGLILLPLAILLVLFAIKFVQDFARYNDSLFTEEYRARFDLDRTGDYFHYLYFNQDDYHREVQFINEENGRYVASEDDLSFYIDSGRWKEVVGPLIATWWVLMIVATGVMYTYRDMARVRESRY